MSLKGREELAKKEFSDAAFVDMLSSTIKAGLAFRFDSGFAKENSNAGNNLNYKVN